MPTQIGDVFQVTTKYKYDGQDMANTYFYQYALFIEPLGTTFSQVLAERFDELVMPVVGTIFPTQAAFTSVDVKNLMFPDDAYELPIARTGLASWADRLPRHDTVGFTLTGENKSTRRGGKRLGILNESVVTNGTISLGSTIANLATISVRLALPVTTYFLFSQDTFRPCIVKRIKEGEAPNITYRLPITRTEQVLNTIVSVGVSMLMTTQNTRKR